MSAQGPSAFGALLRRHRQAAGLTQEELAERAHLSARAVIDLERGARLTPRRETVQWLADALDLTSADQRAFEAAARRRHQAGAPLESRSLGAPAAAPAPSGGFLGALRLGALVGREVELSRLLAALDQTAAGRAQLVLVAGEPGIGKTRLAQEVMLQAEDRGFRVLVGRCYEQYTLLPFSPFIDLLNAAYALASPSLRQEAPRHFAALGQLVADLGAGPPLPENMEARLRVLHAVGGFLAALAAEAPLALLLDDLHWADSASLDLLHLLARRLQGTSVLLLGTYRDVEVNRQHPLERLLSDLARERLMEELHLHGLSVAGTAALIGAHLGVQAVSVDLTTLVHDRTEGNPFFTEEVLTALVEQGAIVQSGTGWDRKAVQAVAVPRSVRSVVGQRVGRLPAGAQELLQAASVLGQEWDLSVLVEMMGLDEDTLLEYLDAAFAARLLEERRAGRVERYGFAHALIGQALSAEVPPYRLRRLHLRAGETLERLSAEQPEAWAALARHFQAGGDAPRAIRYAVLAGDYAANLYAHAEASQHYEAALALLEETGAVGEVARVREKLGVAWQSLGRYEAALAVLELAAATWHTLGDLAGLGRAMAEIGTVHAVRGTPQDGVHRLLAVLPSLEAGGAPAALAAVCEALAYLQFASGNYVAFLSAAERAAGLARVLGDGWMVARAEMHRGNALQMLGRVDEALRVNEAAMTLAAEAGDLWGLAACRMDSAYIDTFRGQFGSARRYSQQAVEAAERHGEPHIIILTAAGQNRLLYLLGEWALVRKNMGQALALSRQIGESLASPWALHMLGTVLLAEGRWDEAARDLQEASDLAARIGDLQAQRWAAGPLAELAVLEGRPDVARARLVPLLDRPSLEEFDVTVLLPVLAWAYLELGDVEQATVTVVDAIRRARAGQVRVVLAEALRVLALIDIRQGRFEPAEEAVHEGLHLVRAMPWPYGEARLLVAAGSVYAARAVPDQARERLEAALAIFQRLGARMDSERTALLLSTLE